MADIAELTRLLSYFRAGGGKRKTSVGDFISSLGTAASGIGTGFRAAAEPAIAEQRVAREELDTKRKNAATLLGKAIDEGAPFTGQDALSILDTGSFPKNYTFSGKQPQPEFVFDPRTGSFIKAPSGGKVHTVPYPPREGGSGTKDKKAEAAVNKLVSAARTGKFTMFNQEDGDMQDIAIESPETFDELVTMSSVDPDDPRIVKARESLATAPKKPGLMERIAAKAGSMKRAFTGATSPATVTVETSDGQVVEIAADKLAEAKKRDPKLKVRTAAK